MFKTIKLYAKWLFTNSEDAYEQIVAGVKNMGVKTSNEATIAKKGDKFILRSEDGTVVKHYSRRRDAVRGADRLGLIVV